jgi:hypothetical protein
MLLHECIVRYNILHGILRCHPNDLHNWKPIASSCLSTMWNITKSTGSNWTDGSSRNDGDLILSDVKLFCVTFSWWHVSFWTNSLTRKVLRLIQFRRGTESKQLDCSAFLEKIAPAMTCLAWIDQPRLWRHSSVQTAASIPFRRTMKMMSVCRRNGWQSRTNDSDYLSV